MKKRESCIPLELTNQLTTKYNDCWTMIEKLIEDRKKGTLPITWNDYCYIPIGACIAIITLDQERGIETVKDATRMAAIAPWRLYKQIYCFTPEMEELLFSQTEDIVIPIDVLYNLPYDSIYIQTKTLEGMDGFFCHFESDKENHSEEFRLLLVEEGLETTSIALHLKLNGTISDAINDMIKQSKQVAKNIGDDIALKKIQKGEVAVQEYLASLASMLMQLVLYICSSNADIKEDPVQKKITKIPTSSAFIKDKRREIKKWNCGEEAVKIIHGIYNYHPKNVDDKSSICIDNADTADNKVTSQKRPHARRGHWHYYWTGSKKEGQHLVLKWIAPTFIHADDFSNDVIIKINNIKE